MADKTKGATLPPWMTSKAKRTLRTDIIEGKVTAAMDPVLVYGMHEAYKTYPYKRFKPNLKNLLEAVAKKKDSAEEDKAAFAHFMQNMPAPINTRTSPLWHRSIAEGLLKQDITAGVHRTMQPKQFRASRPEYMAFTLKNFRDHARDEVRKRNGRSYWLAQKKQKGSK